MDARDPLLSIGVFARRSRLSPKALRLYERHGLLVPAHVDDDNGYRRYRESQLRDARMVRMLRRLDMPLAQAAQLMSAPRDTWPELLGDHWQRSEQRFAAQRLIAEHLTSTLSGSKEMYPMYNVQIREVPEQTVLTEQRHVTAPELPEWIAGSLGRQHAALDRVGGQTGPSLVIYHGEVNEDSDGPAESCTPIDSSRAAEAGVPTRVEPAHREAFTRITKAQVRFPDIISAYDAVETWVAQNGHTLKGSPREVYFVDMMDAAPDDEVVDIAFPIA